MKRVVSKMEIDNPKTGGILIHPSLDVSHLVAAAGKIGIRTESVNPVVCTF